MLLSIRIRNFKRFEDTGEIPLGRSVVFIGPNNCGKTSALQALSLWQIGVSKWLEKKGDKSQAKTRTGTAINRKDLFSIPTPAARMLWHDLNVRVKSSKRVFITIEVRGITNGKEWRAGLEFDHTGEEVFYCRPMSGLEENALLIDPESVLGAHIAYLPPMSGLVPEENKLLMTTVNAYIGEGRTAEVLRNLCYQLRFPETANGAGTLDGKARWMELTTLIEQHFGVKLHEPELTPRGSIAVSYTDNRNNTLDLSSSGRGLQQVMLLLAYMFSNPSSALLLDEPDAHLEVLRQQRVYNLLSQLAEDRQSQIIVASHSEKVMDEAAGKDMVISFVSGQPKRVDNQVKELRKSLVSIGFDHYYLAELKGWILFLEGSSDLRMLVSLAKRLNHDAATILESPFVHYLSNNRPGDARNHFNGLRHAVPQLQGVAVFDNISAELNSVEALHEYSWRRNELENYFFDLNVLLAYAKGANAPDLFAASEQETRIAAMHQAIADIVPGIAQQDPGDEYWAKRKASDELDRIFRRYFERLGAYNVMDKRNFHELIAYVDPASIDQEVRDVLDLIVSTDKQAKKADG